MITAASRKGVLFKCRCEGFALGAYLDDSTGAGRHSAGFGHQGPDVEPGKVYTPQQVFAWLQADVEARELDLNRHLAKRKLDVTQQQYDALLSRYYQAGTDNLVAILDVWPMIVAKGSRASFNAVWLANCVNQAGDRLDGLQDRGLMELLIIWRGVYRDWDLYDIPFWRGNPTGRPPNGTYRVKPDDIPWRP